MTELDTREVVTRSVERRRGSFRRNDPPRVGNGAAGVKPRQWYQWWFALPAAVLVLFFFFVPFIANAFFAFTQWTGYSSVITFNGLQNFQNLIDRGVLWQATLITLVYAVIGMVTQNAVGLSLAKALQHTGRANTVFRSIFFIPVLISPLAAGYIWKALLQPEGFVNDVISLFVPGDFTFAWLGNAVTALIAVACIDAWKWSGMATLVYIAGLNRIPGQLVEAATLDGAGAWRRFWAIEFPLLAPAFTFNIVITFVGAFSAFDGIVATTGGGPGTATTVLNKAAYDQYGQGLFGTASALNFVVALLVICTAIPLIAWMRKREERM
ncbi:MULTISPECIES: sugar ABC transporter permease [unclassified Microbacterium]|uniref:carbohydrate ABC transporter permease n=1 Tax=unclassified Microbacterium TaxID=2609290 RepID=UPI00214C6373|nr:MULTISPECIES: sugar ABC transporter permease [unclassified Microbacterium]MCR2783983.1 sugar ABC transporter permease [Microbacterium sp. zg.B96]WIM15173.1 sugar ABC transporter permease [Microbacterium sp. zg-B96]